MAINVGGIMAYLDLETSQFNTKLAAAQGEVGSFATSLGSAGDKMVGVGKTLSLAVTAPIVGVGLAAIKLGTDFDSSMSEVQAISGATGSDMAKLEGIAREMGATTKFSASDAADGLKFMAMAGWETQDMMAGLPAILNLAAASGEDLGLTSDIVTDSLTGFGLAATDAGRFADVLAAASSNSNTNVALMGETFKYVAPVAGALGFSVEDTALAVGLMANAGIKGSQSGTALRAAITNLVKPTDKMQAMMDSLGISVVNSDGSMKSLREIMDNLRSSMGNMTEEQKKQALGMLESADATEIGRAAMQGMTQEEVYFSTAMGLGNEAIKDYTVEQLNSALATELSKKEIAAMTLEQKQAIVAQMLGTTALEGLTEAEQASAAATIFGKEAMSGMLAIVNASDEDYNKLASSIDNSAGSAEKMAKTMQDNLKGSIDNIKSALEEAALKIYNVMLPSLESLAEKIQGALDWFNGLSEGSQKFIVKVALVAAAIGPLLIVLGTLAGAISNIMGIVTTMTSLFATAGGAAGVGAFVTAMGTAAATAAPFILAGGLIVGAVVSIAKSLGEDAIPAVDLFGDSVSENTQKAVQDYLDLEHEATQSLNELNWSGQAITAEMASEIGGNFEAMKDQVVASLEAKKQESQAVLEEMWANSNHTNQTEIANQLEAYDTMYQSEIDIANGRNSQIQGILETASNEKRELTEAERKTISAIQENQKEDAIRIFSESEKEQLAIMERLKSESGKISALQAAEIVKNSVEQKDKTVAEAEDEYNQRLKIAGELRTKGTDEANKMADAIIKEATKQKEETITQAEEMHDKVVKEAKSQAKEHVHEVDWSTGEIKSKWTVTNEKVTAKVSEMEQKVVQHFKTLAADANTWTTQLETNVKTGYNNMVKAVKEKAAEVVKATKDKFEETKEVIRAKMDESKEVVGRIIGEMPQKVRDKMSDMLSAGGDLISGLISGINNMKERAINAITNVVDGVVNKAKSFLKIQSPSRVFMEIGEFTVEGFSEGIDNKKKQAQDSITKVMDSVKQATIDANKEITELNLQANKDRESALKKANESMAKIRKDAQKDKRALTKEDNQKIADIQADFKDKAVDLQKKLSSDIAKVRADRIKTLDSLQAEEFNVLKGWIDSKKDYESYSLTEQYKDWQAIQTLYKEGSKEREESERQLVSVKQEIHKELDNLNKDYINKITATNDALVIEEAKLNDAYDKALESRTASYTSFAGIFDEVKVKAEVSGKQLIENLKGQVVQMNTWADDFASLSQRGVDDGLLAQLRNMGPKAGAEIAALNSLTDKELEEYVGLWKEKSETAMKLASEDLEGMKEDTEKKIDELHKQTEIQLDALKDEWSTKILEIRNGTEDEFNAMNASLEEIGSNAIVGMIDGLSSMENDLYNKAQSIADMVKSTIQSAFDIKSPSRWMRDMIGKNLMYGLVDGIDSGKTSVISKAAEISDWMKPSIEATQLSISGEKSRGSINSSMLSPTSASSGSYDRSNSSGSRNITQNITINSPKALSPSEISRKNLQVSRQLAAEWGV